MAAALGSSSSVASAALGSSSSVAPGVAVVVEWRQGVAVLAVVADVAVVSGVSGSSCSRSSGSRRRQACQGVAVVSAALVFDW